MPDTGSRPRLFTRRSDPISGSRSSFRDAEDLLAERGLAVSYEIIRRWVNHFRPMIAADLRKRRQKPHTTWHLNEVYLKIDGRMVYGPTARHGDSRGRGDG
jgi:transposase-like protein